MVTKFNVIVKNIENIKINVNETPPLYSNSNRNKDFIYETSYSDHNNNSQIEITFSECLSDYKILLNYNVISTNKDDEYVDSKVVFIDEQYRKHTIHNFNYLFNYKYITSQSLFRFINKLDNEQITSILSNATENQINNINIKGQSGKVGIKNVISHDRLSNKNENKNNIASGTQVIMLNGGIGGGGDSIADRKSKLVIASGGGGYLCGNPFSLKGKFDLDYSGGSGGSSYIKKLNYLKEWINKTPQLYSNSYNNTNGFIIIQKINRKSEQNEMNSEIHNSELDNTNNTNNTNDNSLNSNFNFVNHKTEHFIDMNSDILDKKRRLNFYDTLINNTKRFKIIESSIQTTKQIEFIKIDENQLNSEKWDNFCVAIKSNLPFHIKLIGWDKDKYITSIFNINNNDYENDSINYQETNIYEDISQHNHGVYELNPKNMTQYLETCIKNNSYWINNNILTNINSRHNKKLGNTIKKVIKNDTYVKELYLVIYFNGMYLEQSKEVKIVLSYFNNYYKNEKNNKKDILNRTSNYLYA